MKGNFILLLFVFSFGALSAQCHEDTTFLEYHYLCPEMIRVADSTVNIKTNLLPGDSMHYEFIYALPNDHMHPDNTRDGIFAREIMWKFNTHRLRINGMWFTGIFTIAQKYHIWGVENDHAGLMILKIDYESGKIIRKENIPDPTADPAKEMEMY